MKNVFSVRRGDVPKTTFLNVGQNVIFVSDHDPYGPEEDDCPTSENMIYRKGTVVRMVGVQLVRDYDLCALVEFDAGIMAGQTDIVPFDVLSPLPFHQPYIARKFDRAVVASTLGKQVNASGFVSTAFSSVMTDFLTSVSLPEDEKSYLLRKLADAVDSGSI